MNHGRSACALIILALGGCSARAPQQTPDTGQASGTPSGQAPGTPSAVEDTAPPTPGDSAAEHVGFDVVQDPGSSSAAEFPCEWDEADCPSDCYGNTAPVLFEPEVWVNGATGVDLVLGDTVTLALSFEDVDGNLACGTYIESIRVPGLMADTSGSLCSNLPAGTSASDVQLAAELELDEPGAYSLALRLVDVCGAQSEQHIWTVELP